MKVREAMTNDVCVTSPDRSIREAARLMSEIDAGALPVGENDRLVGMITDRDIAVRAVAEGRDGTTTSVGHVMSSDVRTSAPDDSVEDVMELMGREQVRRIPIVDDRGNLVGIVAQADIVLEAPDNRKAEKTVEKISQPSGKHAQ